MGKLSKLSLGLFNKNISLADLSLEEESIERSLKDCRRFLVDRKKKCLSLVSDLENLIQTKESLQDPLKEVYSLLKSLEENYLSLCERKELEEKKNALFVHKKDSTQDKVTVYKKEIKDIQKEITNLSEKSDDIENKITLLKSVEKEEREKHSYFYKKLQKIEMKYLELEAQKEKLWESSEILKNTHENTQKDLEKAQKELRLLNQELEVKKLDNDTIYRNVTVLDEKLSSIKTERKMILCEIEKMKETISSYSQKERELKNQTEDYKKFLLEAHDLKESWKIKLKREKKALDENSQIHDQEKERFCSVNNEYLKIKKETEAFNKEYKEIQEMISLYQREQEETLKKINIEKKNINLLKNKIKDSAEKREKSSLEFKQVEDQLIQVTSKKNELENILKKELSKKDDCEKRLLTEKNNIKFLYEEIKKNEDEIFNVDRKIKSLDKKITLEEVERSRVLNILSQTKIKLTDILEDCLRKEKSYEQAILATNEVRTNVDSVNNEITRHEIKAKKLIDEKNSLKNSIVSLNKDYNLKRSECIKTKNKLSKISEEIASLRGEKKLKEQSSIVLEKEILEYKNKIIVAQRKLGEMSLLKNTQSDEHGKLATEYKKVQKIYNEWNEKIELKAQEINIIEMRDRDYIDKTNELQLAIDAKKRELSKLEEKLKSKRKNISDHAYLVSSLSQALSDIDLRIDAAKNEILEEKEVSSLYLSKSDENQWKAFKTKNARLNLAEETFGKLIEEVQNQEFDELDITHVLRDGERPAGKLMLKNLATRAQELKGLVRPYALVLKEEGISLRLKTQVDKNQVCRTMIIEWEKEEVSSDNIANQIN